MNILHIVPSYKPAYVYGGTIESIARLCEAQAYAGNTVKVFTTTANGNTELSVTPNKEYNVEGVGVTYFSRIFKDPFYLSPALWKQLYKDCRHFDVVHIHSWWNMIVLFAAFICKKKKVKFIVSPRGMMSDYILNNSKTPLKRVMQALGGRALLKASVFHATSPAEFEECRRVIPGWQGFVIPNIIWLPELETAKIAGPVFTIIYMSRIHPKKGIELLLEAISRLEKKPLLKMAGSGEEEYVKKLQQQAKDLGIEQQVEWLGWQDREQKFKLLREADLFALTSYNENFANSVIEALHCGTPVLISGEVALSRFVEEHELGWTCQTEVNSIETKLETAMADIEARKRINRCAPVMIKKYFAEEKLAAEYIQQYNCQMISGRP